MIRFSKALPYVALVAAIALAYGNTVCADWGTRCVVTNRPSGQRVVSSRNGSARPSARTASPVHQHERAGVDRIQLAAQARQFSEPGALAER